MRLILVLILLSLCFSHIIHAVQIDLPASAAKERTELLVMVLSHGADDRRNSLRETWLRDETNRTKWVFTIGNIDKSPQKEQVLQEQKKYNDILILNDVNDDYEHLSDKVLKGFKAIYEKYEFDYVLKVDTDTFVILPKLLAYLQNHPPKKSYIGYIAYTTSKKEIYGFLSGIYYMLGGGYLLSYDLVEYFAHSQHLMKRSYSEDATVGIHLHSLDITWLGHPDTVFKTGAAAPCSCETTLMVNHKCKKTDMYYMYYSYQQTAKICEYRTNKTYAQELADTYHIPTNDEKLLIRW